MMHTFHKSATPQRDCQRILPMAEEDIAWSLSLRPRKSLWERARQALQHKEPKQ